MPADAAAAPPRPGVLLVDDDDQVRRLLEVILSKAGYCVCSADSGAAALVQASRHASKLQLVLLDVNMPGLDGAETWACLRELAPQLRCLFMSGFPHPYTEKGLLDLGALRVLWKPFSEQELLSALCAALGPEGHC